MDKKLLFNEALASLVEFAAANGNLVTKEDIRTYFKDIIEDESQYELIYAYLNESKIRIQGMDNMVSEELTDNVDSSADANVLSADANAAETIETEEELAFIEMYMNDLEAIMPASDEEVTELVTALVGGDTSVSNRLVEVHLSLVAETAKSYKGHGVTYGDLIQEGNMGLMEGIAEFAGEPSEFSEYIKEYVNKALSAAVNEQINSSRVGEHLANRMNRLDTISTELTKELGRAPSFAELSEKMGLSEDEIETIVKTSLNALNSGTGSDESDFDVETSDKASYEEVTEFIQNELGDDEDYDDEDIGPSSDPLEWRINKKS